MRLQNLNNSTCALFQCQTFKHNVIAIGLLDVDKGVLAPVCLEDIWIDLLTYLATKSSPVDGPTSESPVLVLLRLQPVLQAYVVDVADTTATFAD